MMNDIKNDIRELRLLQQRTEGADELAVIKKKIYQKKIALLDLIHVKDKARAGMTARQLMLKVKNMPVLPKFSTGIAKIDSAFGGGFETGLFINLAGESSAGKTTLLMHLIANMAKARQTVFFNFEMGDRLFVKKLKVLNLNDKQLDNLIIDSETNSIDELIMEIEIYAEDGVKFFAIDSKMKLQGGKGANEVQSISLMSAALARLAARKDIVIFLINQMNEQDIQNKRLAFKGSGDQKYDSDIALFITKEGENRQLICTKNRMNDKLFSIPITVNDYSDAGFEEIVFESQPETQNNFYANVEIPMAI